MVHFQSKYLPLDASKQSRTFSSGEIDSIVHLNSDRSALRLSLPELLDEKKTHKTKTP